MSGIPDVYAQKSLLFPEPSISGDRVIFPIIFGNSGNADVSGMRTARDSYPVSLIFDGFASPFVYQSNGNVVNVIHNT
jgi:hypothetical protein